jgi:hypothetical protein
MAPTAIIVCLPVLQHNRKSTVVDIEPPGRQINDPSPLSYRLVKQTYIHHEAGSLEGSGLVER